NTQLPELMRNRIPRSRRANARTPVQPIERHKMSDDLHKLQSDYVRGQVTRRDLLIKGGALGLSAPAIAALLAACGSDGGSPSSGGPGSKPVGGTTVLTPPAKGEVGRVKWGLFYEPPGPGWIFYLNFQENTVAPKPTPSPMP